MSHHLCLIIMIHKTFWQHKLLSHSYAVDHSANSSNLTSLLLLTIVFQAGFPLYFVPKLTTTLSPHLHATRSHCPGRILSTSRPCERSKLVPLRGGNTGPMRAHTMAGSHKKEAAGGLRRLRGVCGALRLGQTLQDPIRFSEPSSGDGHKMRRMRSLQIENTFSLSYHVPLLYLVYTHTHTDIHTFHECNNPHVTSHISLRPKQASFRSPALPIWLGWLYRWW